MVVLVSEHSTFISVVESVLEYSTYISLDILLYWCQNIANFYGCIGVRTAHLYLWLYQCWNIAHIYL